MQLSLCSYLATAWLHDVNKHGEIWPGWQSFASVQKNGGTSGSYVVIMKLDFYEYFFI